MIRAEGKKMKKCSKVRMEQGWGLADGNVRWKRQGGLHGGVKNSVKCAKHLKRPLCHVMSLKGLKLV